MKALIVFMLIAIAGIISNVVEKYNSRGGEILGMAMVQPLLLFLFLIVGVALYQVCCKFFRLDKQKASNRRDSECPLTAEEKRDIFFERNITSKDLIKYKFFNRLRNKQKAMRWNVSCTLIQGKIHSIVLYADDTDAEEVVQIKVTGSGGEYLVMKGSLPVGCIKITDKILQYIQTDNKKTYSANFESEANEGLGSGSDWLLTLFTLDVQNSQSIYNYFSLQVDNDEIVGRIDTCLKNIDLTADANNKFDVRIAGLFAIFIDNVGTI